MQFKNRSPRLRTDRGPLSGRKLAPMIEVMEDRQLMTAGAGFLTGSVLLDGTTGAPVPGVTVELFKASNTGCPVSIQTTGANGQYLFTGLQSGDYLLKEFAPKGYTANGANPVSQLNPASAVGSDTIKVTVVDPKSVYVNYGGIVRSSASVVNDVVQGHALVNSVGPQADTLGSAAGATDLNAGFQTFCVNDLQSLSFSGGESYRVTPRPISELNNGTSAVSADHSGRIAYLFNHYGNSSLSNVQGAGLQLAIWELLYDCGNTADFNSGAFQVTGQNCSFNGETLSQVLAQATCYFNESACKSETAVFLDAASANPCVVNGLQSVLATESLNFSVHRSATPCDTGGRRDSCGDDHRVPVCDTGGRRDSCDDDRRGSGGDKKDGGSSCDTGGRRDSCEDDRRGDKKDGGSSCDTGDRRVSCGGGDDRRGGSDKGGGSGGSSCRS